ncbi:MULTISPECIES: helix-turn-helix domain-containing protein [unclassified Streptomyces]|uniref:helix-turn-helix domain-containing protein n=1 Tax=unclassified Streptomyces TaxID=2593676 RepID=UPI0038079925
MPEKPEATGGPEGPENTRARSDLGRRAVARRTELGLTREDVALRAGSAPGYIQYLEEGSAAPGTGFLLRLADALETTAEELVGATADLPVGVGRAGLHPVPVPLSPEECHTLLSTRGVGRVVVTVGGDPAVFPVNYTVDGDLVAFRTAPGAAPAAAVGRSVAFEVDHIDDPLSQGWSVLVVGAAQVVTDPGQVLRLEERAPWAGGDRGLWIGIPPAGHRRPDLRTPQPLTCAFQPPDVPATGRGAARFRHVRRAGSGRPVP